MTEIGQLAEARRNDTAKLVRRIVLFTIFQLVGLVAPVLGLPVVARVGNEAEWVGIGVGQSIGVFAQIVIMWGWAAAGPTRFALLRDEGERFDLYEASLRQRALLFGLATPIAMVIATAAAPSGGRLIAALAVVAGAAAGLSPSWFYMSKGQPVWVALSFDLPMAIAVVASATLVAVLHVAWIYPCLQIVVALSCPFLVREALRRRTGRRDGGHSYGIRRSLYEQWPIAASNVIGTGYSNVPVPLASAITSSGVASLSSADRVFRLASYAPSVLVNSLQAWVLEREEGYRRRQLIGLTLHGCLGMLGFGGIILLGPTLSALLFGEGLHAHGSSLMGYALAFLFVSVGAAVNRLILIPSGNTKVILLSGVVGAVAGLAVAAALTKAVGASGAPWGLACSEIVVLAMTILPASRSLGRYPQNVVADLPLEDQEWA